MSALAAVHEEPDGVNVRTLILAQLETNETDPGVIAEKVLTQIPQDEYEAALRSLLRRVVTDVIRCERNKPAAAPSETPPANSRWPGAAGLYCDLLMKRIEIGGAEYKMLGDCTRDDLLYAVESRKEQAKALYVAAKRYKAIVAMFDEHPDARNVADLPLDQVTAVFA